MRHPVGLWDVAEGGGSRYGEDTIVILHESHRLGVGVIELPSSSIDILKIVISDHALYLCRVDPFLVQSGTLDNKHVVETAMVSLNGFNDVV